MKRILLILMMLALAVTMIAGCAKVEQEEFAESDGFVEDFGDDSDNNAENNGPQKVPSGDNNADPEDEGADAPSNNTSKPDNNTSKPDNNTSKPDNNTSKPDDNKKPDNSKEEDDPVFDDDEDDKPIDYSDWMTVATFNVKSFFNGNTTDLVEQQVKELDADIIGFQEISVYDPEYGNMHQIEYLAKKCGYKYWDFVETVDNTGKGRGQYGHGILSKYPIKSKEHVDYTFQKGEHREYARYVLDVDGTDVVYYNTHLTVSDSDPVLGVPQYKELLKRAYTEKNPVIVTGDFNLLLETAQKPNLDTKRLLPMIGLESMTIRPHRNLGIDNIMISPRHWDYYLNEGQDCGVMWKESQASDHYMIWTYLKLK